MNTIDVAMINTKAIVIATIKNTAKPSISSPLSFMMRYCTKYTHKKK